MLHLFSNQKKTFIFFRIRAEIDFYEATKHVGS